MANTPEHVLNGYFAEFVQKPERRVYKPSEWLTRGYSPKRLAKALEKGQAQLDREYEIQMREYTRYTDALAKVLACPAGLMDFFVRSLQDWVEDCRAKRNILQAQVNGFKAKWDRQVPIKGDGKYEYTESPYRKAEEIARAWWKWNNGASYHTLFTEKALEGCLKDGAEVHDYYHRLFDAFAPNDEEKTDFCKEVIMWCIAKKKHAEVMPPAEVFTMTLLRLGEIVDAMTQTLGGMPDGCEYESDWGAGGHYNGIVSRGAQKAKFTSFFAGGWNIQRLHVRFKITLLKEAGAAA